MGKRGNLDLRLNTSDSQVFGSSSDSLLLPSEPPDIRNWFSSYVYESPESNIGENLEGCGSLRGNDCEKEGYDVEESQKENEENLGKCRRLGKSDEFIVDEKLDSKEFVRSKNSVGNNNYGTQVLDSSDSLSISSEDNINNWFSSYVYDSPTLDTSEDFAFSDFKESKVDGEGCSAGKRSQGKEEDLREYRRNGKMDDLVGKKTASTGSVLCNSSGNNNMYEHQYACKGKHGVDGNKRSSVLNDLPYKRISEEILDGKRAQNHNDVSTKDIEKNLTVENDVSSGSKLDLIAPNENSLKKTCRSNDDGNDFAANGFISMKKKTRVNDENSLKMPLGVQYESLRNGVTVSSVGNDGTLQRKVLSERTNFQNSDVLGVTGQWKCPQKSKPDLGPPLRQLRLEKWVHRV